VTRLRQTPGPFLGRDQAAGGARQFVAAFARGLLAANLGEQLFSQLAKPRLVRIARKNGVESREQPPFSPSSIVAVQNGPGGTRQPEEFHPETGRRYAPSVC